MRKGVIYFTNLGIVKSNEFEFTNDRFFTNMKNMITKKPNQNFVTYDEEKNEYKIAYNNCEYEVILGKDGYLERTTIVDMLNELVEISTFVERIRKEENDKNQYIDEQRKQIFDNAKKGIIRTNEEKQAAIKINNDEYKNGKYKFWKEVFKIFKKLNWRKDDIWFVAIDAVATVIFCIAGGVTSALGLVVLEKIAEVCACVSLSDLFSTMLINSLIDEFGSCCYGYGIRGIWLFVFSLVTLPLNMVYNLGKKIKNVAKHYTENKRLQNGIHDIKNTRIIHKSKKNIDEVNKFIDEYAVKNMAVAPTNLHKTIEVVTSLKDKILEVKDNRLSKKFAKELYEIINYYTDASINISEKDKASNILSSQLIDLKERVDKELENENNKNNEECDNLIESIEHQKSIGARK